MVVFAKALWLNALSTAVIVISFPLIPSAVLPTDQKLVYRVRVLDRLRVIQRYCASECAH